MKLFLVLLFVLLVLQLLSASAQPVSDTAVGQNTTHTPAPDHIALLQQCEADLQEAIVQSSNHATEVETKQVQNEDLGSRLQKCEENLHTRTSTSEVKNKNCQEELRAENDKNHNCQEELEALKMRNSIHLRDFVNKEFELGIAKFEIDTLQHQLANADEKINTLKHASQQAAPAETCIKDENLEAELANARQQITELENAKKLIADQVVKLTEELEKARHSITELEIAQQQIPVNRTSSENSKFPDITIVVFTINVVVMATTQLQRWWNPTRLTYIKNDSVCKNLFYLWKTREQRLVRKYAWFWRQLKEQDIGMCYVCFFEWKILCKRKIQQRPRVEHCSTANFQVLMQTFMAENLERVRKLNKLLENVWTQYNMEGHFEPIQAKGMKFFQDTLYKQIDTISSRIALAYGQFDPITAQRILSYLPKMQQVLRAQQWCRNFLYMKRYVTKFRLLLHSEDAQALSLYKFGSVYKFARQANGIQNKDTTSLPARLRKAKVLKSYAPTMHSLFDTIYDKSNIIWKELEKRRHARDYRRNLSSNFWNLLTYCKRIVAVVLRAVNLAIVVFALSIGICLALYEFYRVPEVCGVTTPSLLEYL